MKKWKLYRPIKPISDPLEIEGDSIHVKDGCLIFYGPPDAQYNRVKLEVFAPHTWHRAVLVVEDVE